jgi:hypothetical protein
VARDRPRSSALRQPQAGLVGIGLEPKSPLALALVARGGQIVDSLIVPSTHLVVGARASDPAMLVAEALASGRRVIVEDPASFLAAPGSVPLDRVFAGFTYRFEPAAAATRASLQAGTIGLPFAVTAEAAGRSCVDSAGLALDLLDAVLHVTGLALESAVRVGTDPFVISLLLADGVVGDVSAVVISTAESIANLSVRGSHGSLLVNLGAPHVVEVTDRMAMLRLGEQGPGLLLDAFCSDSPLPTLADAASLVAASRRDS